LINYQSIIYLLAFNKDNEMIWLYFIYFCEDT